MRIETKLVAAALGAATLWASPAYAQATRTWVSGVGDDVNPCSRTAPCKTFAGAISKTAAGGEIDCLDPAGYGTLTITKSITVDCTGTFGSVLNSGGINGFVINDSATATPGTIEVRLRGLSINGAGTTPGLNGVRFLSGKSLFLEDVIIQNQKGGAGVSLQPTTAGIKVFFNNVTIVDGSTGILVQPTGTGTAKVSIRDTRVAQITNNGLRVDTSSTSAGGTQVNVDNSTFATNGTGISINSGTTLTVAVNGSTVVNNVGTGIGATGASSTVIVGNTTITGNALGVGTSGGAVMFTFGDNRNEGNPSFAAPNNGTFTLPIIGKD